MKVLRKSKSKSGRLKRSWRKKKPERERTDASRVAGGHESCKTRNQGKVPGIVGRTKKLEKVAKLGGATYLKDSET